MGIIYKLYNPETNICYIGSTKQSLIVRLKRHLRHYKSYIENKHNYIYSFKILETNNYKIEKIEDVEDDNNLKIRESFYINSLECVNKYISYRTVEDIKEQQKKDNLKYKLKNPEKYKEHQNKRSIKIICSCGCEISKRNIARHLKTHLVV
jgi:hypothetical protein